MAESVRLTSLQDGLNKEIGTLAGIDELSDLLMFKLHNIEQKLVEHRTQFQNDQAVGSAALGNGLIVSLRELSATTESVSQDLNHTLQVVTYDALKHESVLGEREAAVYQGVSWFCLAAF